MAISQQNLTLEEFLKLPEKKPALEFEDGVVTRKMSPKGHHSILQGELLARFNRFAQPRKVAYAFPELRTTFAGASVVPDVAVYVWDRIPRVADGRVANDFFLPPDIAIEIVSPRQGVNQLVRRCVWYVEHGVRMSWLVDPQDRSVIIFRPDSRTSALRGQQQIEVGEIIPGFQLAVEALFAALELR